MDLCLFRLVKNKRHDENISLNFLTEVEFSSTIKLSKVVSPVYKAVVGVVLRISFGQ